MPNIYVILIVVASSLIKGVTGFGFALFSLPILLTWYEPAEIIPVLMICNLVASIFIVLQRKENKLVDKSSAALIISGGLFTLIGVLLLKYLEASCLLRLSAIVFIMLTLISIVSKRSVKKNISIYTYSLVGAVIGLITGAISISGPPLALFLNKARVDNKTFREVFAWFSILSASVAIVAYVQTGLLTFQVLQLSLLFSPLLLAGTIIGKYLNQIISVKHFRTINFILTIISCLLLLNR